MNCGLSSLWEQRLNNGACALSCLTAIPPMVTPKNEWIFSHIHKFNIVFMQDSP